MAQQQTRAINQADLQQALGLLPTGNVPAEQLSLFTQLLGSQLLGGLNQQQGQDRGGNGDRPAGGTAGRPARSSDSRSSSAYASRHQAAEQRRRTRINERLDLLRKMVPHAERANTACFLEEVIKYIDTLKKRNMELEKQLLALRASGNNVQGSAANGNMSAMLGAAGAGPSNARHDGSALTAAAAMFAVAAADAAQQQQLQQQQPSTSGNANGANNGSGERAGGSRDVSTSPPPGTGLLGQRLGVSNPLAGLQPAMLAAAMRMGEPGNMASILEQAIIQGALSNATLNPTTQQHVARLAQQVGIAAGGHNDQQQQQHEQQEQEQQEEQRKAPYGSTLPPELQKLLHESSGADGAGDAAMMLGATGIPMLAGGGSLGLGGTQQQHQQRSGGSGGDSMSSGESGAPQKKRKMQQM